MKFMRPLDENIREQLNKHLEKIEQGLNADGISIISPILYGLDLRVRDALELIEEKKKTSAEYALLSKLDLGELYQFEQARELSCELLIEWLTKYKFKNWKKTRTREIVVNDEMKKNTAEKIAKQLNNTERWHSHGRGIDKQTLINEIKLEIEDYTVIKGLGDIVRKYFELLRDYMSRGNIISFVHSRRYF